MQEMKKPLSFGSTMLASALGVVIVSVVGGLLMLVSMFAMVAAAGNIGKDEAIVVKKDTFLTLDLGKISGDRTADKLTQAMGGGEKTIGLMDAVAAVRAAADDDCVKGILLKDNGMPLVSWASLEELRDALDGFRGSGKPIVSYATDYSQPGYYVASLADCVCLHPSGMIDLRGMGAEVMYYKDLLDKVGVDMQLIRPESCAYKSAGEVYTLSHMSPANREQIRAYIGSIWHTASTSIAEARSMDVEHLNAIVDNLEGYLADDACAHHLVDTLCFEEDVRVLLKENYDGKHLLPMEKYAKNNSVESRRAASKNVRDRIAVIYAEGNVVDGSSKGMGTAVYGDDIVKALKQASEDDDVKAIVLRVNSPGGAATASESMTHAVMAAKAKKPLVVSMGDLAASAGYEISCMADAIVAQPMTITGSIGVFGTIPSVQKMMQKKLGLNSDTVSTNRNSNGLTVFRPLSPAAMAMMTRNVEDFYKVFVGRVAEGRHMTYDEVHKIARGRVWTGADAKKIGLVDTLGGLDLALRIAAEKAGVEQYVVKDYPKEKDTWTQISELFGEGGDDDLDLMTKARMARQWKLQSKSMKVLSRVEQDLLYVSTAEGLQARLPFVIISD